MITYSRGIIARDPNSHDMVQRHVAIASWRLEDWDGLERSLKRIRDSSDIEVLVGEVLLNMKRGTDFNSVIVKLRKSIMGTIAAASMDNYCRAYDPMIQLSMLNEIESFKEHFFGANKPAEFNAVLTQTISVWDKRLGCMTPSYKPRESLLNLRRILLGLLPGTTDACSNTIQFQQGRLWNLTAKEARKAGYFQTAYSGILQSLQLGYGMARYENAKLLHAQNLKDQAILDLKQSINENLLTSSGHEGVQLISKLQQANVTNFN